MRFAFLGVFDCFRLRPSCSCITSSTTESNSTSHSPRDKRKGTAPLVTFSVPTTNSANSASRVQSFLKLDPSASQNLTREQVQVVRTSQDRPGSDSQSVSLSNPIRLKALADPDLPQMRMHDYSFQLNGRTTCFATFSSSHQYRFFPYPSDRRRSFTISLEFRFCPLNHC